MEREQAHLVLQLFLDVVDDPLARRGRRAVAQLAARAGTTASTRRPRPSSLRTSSRIASIFAS
jgi:hypothetical protein